MTGDQHDRGLTLAPGLAADPWRVNTAARPRPAAPAPEPAPPGRAGPGPAGPEFRQAGPGQARPVPQGQAGPAGAASAAASAPEARRGRPGRAPAPGARRRRLATAPGGAGRYSAPAARIAHASNLAYLVVLVATFAGLAAVWQGGAQRARGGTLAMAGALFVAALARLLLPESWAGMLASRARFLDVVTLAALAGGLLAAGLMLPTPS